MREEVVLSPKTAHRVAVLSFDGIGMFEVAVAMQVFATANNLAGTDLYEVAVAGSDGVRNPRRHRRGPGTAQRASRALPLHRQTHRRRLRRAPKGGWCGSNSMSTSRLVRSRSWRALTGVAANIPAILDGLAQLPAVVAAADLARAHQIVGELNNAFNPLVRVPSQVDLHVVAQVLSLAAPLDSSGRSAKNLDFDTLN